MGGIQVRVWWLIGLAVLAAALVVWPGTFPFDDPYITLHNARALLNGGVDPLYGAPPLAGATSAVHLVIVALLGLLLPLPYAAFLTSLGAAGIYVLGLERLARRADRDGWSRGLLVLIGLSSCFVPFQLVNGLETSLALAVVAWSLVLADDRRLPWLCGLMPFVRPELATLAAPLLARHLWRERNNPGRVVTDLAIASLAALPWCAWYQITTGLPYPNTGSAKIVFYGEYLESWPTRIRMFVVAVTMSGILPLFAGAVGLRRVSAGWCGGLFVITFLVVALAMFPGSMAHNGSRYLAVVVPVLVAGLAPLAREIRWVVPVIAGWSLLVGIHASLLLKDGLVDSAKWRWSAEFVRDKVPAGSVVLVHDAGWIAWLKPNVRLVDVVGLKTPASAAVHAKYRARACEWGRGLDEIARHERATHLVVLEVPFWGCVGNNLRDEGWRLDLLARQPGGFGIYKLTAPQTAAIPR